MAEHIAIELWWPPLIAASKHEIQRDLDAALSDETVRRIEAIIGGEVAVDRGDHDIRQAQVGDGLGQLAWFGRVERIRAAVADVAERAAARALVAHDHGVGVKTGLLLFDISCAVLSDKSRAAAGDR